MIQIDTDILLWINGHHAEWLDGLMWTVSQSKTWVPMYVLLIGAIACAYRGGKRWKTWVPCVVVVLAVAAAAGLADWVSSGVLKPMVERLRPSHEPSLAGLLHIVNEYRGGMYGFPSSHAADTMAVAMSSMLFLQRSEMQRVWKNVWLTVLVCYVIVNCYSRMYLGVHYPTDIATGLLIGATMGYILYKIVCMIFCTKKI